jgi:Flp pilus assembly pilin Flp
MKRFMTTLRDESGIETLEWIAIGVLILLVAFAIYPGALQTALSTVVTDVGTALTTKSTGLAAS